MRESEVERMLVDGIRKLGGRAFKWVSPEMTGCRIGSCPSGISGSVRGSEKQLPEN